MEVDIACVGFGPAMGGFLTTLKCEWTAQSGRPCVCQQGCAGNAAPVLCYERADDIAAGVSGVVTGQGHPRQLSRLNPAEIPMARRSPGARLYLLDPIGASRRSFALRAGDALLRGLAGCCGVKDHAYELPWTPAFLHKHGGLVLSMGQFNQWVGSSYGQRPGADMAGNPGGRPLFAGQRDS